MTLDGELKALMKGLHESHIDLDALLTDKAKGVVTLNLQLRWVTIPQGTESKIVEWALRKYGIDKFYELKARNEQVIGKIDLTKEHSDDDEVSYTQAIEKLGHGMLTPESRTVLEYYEGHQGYNRIHVLDHLVWKKLDRKVNVLQEYLKEKFGFEEGKYEIDGGCDTACITGTVPPAYLKVGEPMYVVEPTVFGKLGEIGHDLDRVVIDTNHGLHYVRIFTRDMVYATGHSPITNKERAVEVLETLLKYAL